MLHISLSLLTSVILLHRRKHTEVQDECVFSQIFFFLPILEVCNDNCLSHNLTDSFVCELSLCSFTLHHTKSENESAVNIRRPFGLVSC